MTKWTQELLESEKIPDWMSIFRFTAITPENMYDPALFESPVWAVPGIDKPVCLLS